MADDYTFEIVEWWDRFDVYHEGAPTEWALEHDAKEVTGHLVWEDGSEKYWDMYSDDGWLIDELEAQVDDAADYYE